MCVCTVYPCSYVCELCACVCLCQIGASPFAPAGCSQSIADDFSFFSHAEPFEEISKHSQSALHVLSCVQCKGFFLPPSPCRCLPACLSFCLSRVETHCLAKEEIHRHNCPVHPWSSLRNFRGNSVPELCCTTSDRALLIAPMYGIVERLVLRLHVLQRGFLKITILKLLINKYI